MNQNQKIPIHETIPITIEVLSPLHIGDGTRLVANYDFLIDKSIVYIFDGAEVCTLKAKSNPQLEYGKALDYYLRPDEFSTFALYQYPVTSHPSEIYCQIKSGGQPYIPGSSLKGSIRTGLLSGMVRWKKIKIEDLDWGTNKKWAASPIERRFLGYSPNEDLFKGLFVRDSELLNSGSLSAAQVCCYHARKDEMYEMGQGFRWTVEAFPVGTKIKSNLIFDRYFLNPPDNSAPFESDKSRLDIIAKTKSRSHWILKNLFKSACAAVKELIQREKDFFDEHNMDDVAEFYSNLIEKNSKNPNHLLLPLGWGTGWQSKTLGMLDLEKTVMDNIRNKYNLGRKGSAEFPMTRRLVVKKDGSRMPLGWVIVKPDRMP